MTPIGLHAMHADYSGLNPQLDQRIPPLFPYAAHLHAFMRCVIFHPDYSPFIPFGDQFELAQKILKAHENYTLTVGDIYYYVACHVEKRNPAPPGVTRSTMLNVPKKIPLKHSSITNLLNDDCSIGGPPSHHTGDAFAYLMEGVKSAVEPEVNAQKLTSSLYTLMDACAPPKEVFLQPKQASRGLTIQDLWAESESGTIRGDQFNFGKSKPENNSARTSHNNKPSVSSNNEANELASLFEIEIKEINSPPPNNVPLSGNLSNLFNGNKFVENPPRVESCPPEVVEKQEIGQKPAKTLRESLGTLFSRE